MRILVTGGTGFIGQSLCPRLAAAGHEVVILSRQSNPRLPGGAARAIRRLDDLPADEVDAVINLAGEPIAEGRWTERRKRLLLDSRVDTTSRLVQWIAAAHRRPQVLVSASAVGYYGDQGDRPVDEGTPAEPGFAHELCAAWEREALEAEPLGVRVCIARIGAVLDRGGGALEKMLPAFWMGVGGRLGSGRQYFPWIHREDMCGILQWLVENPRSTGVYNAGAPNPVTNAEFTRALARTIRRPAVLPVPATAIELLFGGVSEILLGSQRMLPKRLLEQGFEFRYPDIDAALAEMFGRRP